MDPRTQTARGRIKEAMGALTGNQDLKASGLADQAAARAAHSINVVAKTAKGTVNDAAGVLTGAIDKAAKGLKR